MAHETTSIPTYSAKWDNDIQTIIDLFEDTFTTSEGAEEGVLIKTLVDNLLTATSRDDIFVFSVWKSGDISGSIIFSRLIYDQDEADRFHPIASGCENIQTKTRDRAKTDQVWPERSSREWC